ncbi:MAG: hypothetical protein IAE78_32470, partial [Myxococcus sp.]|nr:hypothetical protein [Myxococcus sp.]
MRAGKYTCHAGWMPSCHGCHVELNLTSHQVLQARVLADDSLDPTLL